MSAYRRVLALVALNADAEAVIARALQLSRSYNATLALAAVVDWRPGFECDHAQFLSPAEMRRAIGRDVAARLDDLLAQLGASGAETIVATGDEAAAVADIVRSWRPDLVLVGARATHGLEPAAEEKRNRRFDVLIVQDGRRPGGRVVGRLINALSTAF